MVLPPASGTDGMRLLCWPLPNIMLLMARKLYFGPIRPQNILLGASLACPRGLEQTVYGFAAQP